MNQPIAVEIAQLKEQPLEALKEKYTELYQKPPANGISRHFIWQKITYRIQELRFGGLKDEAVQILKEEKSKLQSLSTDSPSTAKVKRPKRDRRIPMPGTILTREYKRKTIRVKVLESSFEYESRVYSTLSAVAKAVTGSHWNGMKFFHL